MATLLLSAAGSALGAGVGGSVLGLSGAVIGRAVGATLGRAIDQRLLGGGGRAVQTGRVERFRIMGASEGAAVGRVWGRMRVAGQVIWATRFIETAQVQRAGKGAPRAVSTSYSYTVSLAVALCEGVIDRVGRIWADGVEIAPDSYNFRVYPGTEDQIPDAKIEAVEGAGQAPAYRGIAYVVFEDLPLADFGNRVPQLTFEVVRPAQGPGIEDVPDLGRAIRAVAMIPGTGEYALATTPVHFDYGLGEVVSANLHTPGGQTDFRVSLDALSQELPRCEAVSLVVSWFGDDLRAGECRLRPRVETQTFEGVGQVWRAGGIGRAEAGLVATQDGAPVYGGTPSDASVREAIAALKAAGKAVLFYPFVLMEQTAGNSLPDPWTGTTGQPALPWRGRITTSLAPGLPGSPDGTAAAVAEVAAFVGTATPADFTISNGELVYTGPNDWSLRRFVLHYATLCAQAGGVDAFCIGSEFRSLTQIRGPGNSFPMVAALRALAADVRTILGPECKLGYAADWSEYFGYHPGGGEVFFHLDPLWADAEIDFIGIDNYMPLSDWREGADHLDAGWGAIHDLGYLQSNIEGGEGFDWYYANAAHRAAQIRTPITDDAYGEPWIWRYKDIRNWWSQPHHDRPGGLRAATPTAWEPGAKPIWFTEIGCPAVDKGTNQPNVFLDPKSAESALPHFSDGRRDELIQMQYLRAVTDYWTRHAPVSPVYGGPMVPPERIHAWAWDARPFPAFPARADLWSDAENYRRGHWLNGRVSAQPLGSVVGEICAAAGITRVDVSALPGLVRGMSLSEGETGRAALQVLMLALGFDAAERAGKLVFARRTGRAVAQIGAEDLAEGEGGARLAVARAPAAETTGRIRLSYVEAEGDFEARAVEAIFPDEPGTAPAGSELPLALLRSEAQAIAERWLAEARVARDAVTLSLPPSRADLGAGDVIALESDGVSGLYRIDRQDQAEAVTLEAVRVEPGLYVPADEADGAIRTADFVPPLPVMAQFMDLPLLRGDEDPAAPHVAATGLPWPGAVAVWSAPQDAGYALGATLRQRAVIGATLDPLPRARPGVWDRGPGLRIRLKTGALESVTTAALFAGANALAIGAGADGDWEVLQFAQAQALAPGVWEIGTRLRGQAGTDGIMPDVWPVGSLVVLLDGAAEQIPLAESARGLARHYRVGPAGRSYDDPSYTHEILAFSGVGLRPYAPAHLRARRAGSDWDLSWVRRTRIDGDSWESLEVPLGEARELYRLRIYTGSTLRREVQTGTSAFTYSAAMRAADGIAGAFAVHVAQISDAFGAGPDTRIVIDG
ncbi:baseplate multidomain protein megatron [Phaeovulum vinaykumarii]|uniref:Putative phage tail protein n=1 Tax=Phaeovulum vinaykumarii TaxID=407234 RepID=A0A1N7JK79_9RHOB|nr:glycoside hydrolase/phage tail family protein [Phaeovulum vinaykumarii]SIS49710.1 Putative phage tail protein [Phaeovulum vinaykumarii]SOB89859.1 putative tail protein [Phaeovulum vinaykumarii]